MLQGTGRSPTAGLPSYLLNNKENASYWWGFICLRYVLGCCQSTGDQAAYTKTALSLTDRFLANTNSLLTAQNKCPATTPSWKSPTHYSKALISGCNLSGNKGPTWFRIEKFATNLDRRDENLLRSWNLFIGKWRNLGVFNTSAHCSLTVRQFLRNLQTNEAFTEAFTSEKRLMTIKKSLFRHWPLMKNFFLAYFSILVRCKTKGAVVAVRRTAHLAIKCLMANYCIRWRGIFKGFSHDGGWADFS